MNHKIDIGKIKYFIFLIEIEKIKYNVDFSYLYYSKLCSFYKIQCFDIINNKSFSILLPGFELNNLKIPQIEYEKYTDEEITKKILEVLPITSDIFNNSFIIEIFNQILIDYLKNIIQGNIPYSIFDNIFDVFQKILK